MRKIVVFGRNVKCIVTLRAYLNSLAIHIIRRCEKLHIKQAMFICRKFSTTRGWEKSWENRLHLLRAVRTIIELWRRWWRRVQIWYIQWQTIHVCTYVPALKYIVGYFRHIIKQIVICASMFSQPLNNNFGQYHTIRFRYSRGFQMALWEKINFRYIQKMALNHNVKEHEGSTKMVQREENRQKTRVQNTCFKTMMRMGYFESQAYMNNPFYLFVIFV